MSSEQTGELVLSCLPLTLAYSPGGFFFGFGPGFCLTKAITSARHTKRFSNFLTEGKRPRLM